MCRVAISKYSLIASTTRSGSVPSAKEVKPRMSVKTTVTSIRRPPSRFPPGSAMTISRISGLT